MLDGVALIEISKLSSVISSIEGLSSISETIIITTTTVIAIATTTITTTTITITTTRAITNWKGRSFSGKESLLYIKYKR